MDDFDLTCPKGIEPAAWTAILSHRDRLKMAASGTDKALILGRAKELAESVARVVITERGEVAPASMDFPKLIDGAHIVLNRQPGTDLSQDPELRGVVQGAMKIVKGIAGIRNSFGSGHGRAREPEVVDEIVEVAVAATLLWVRWALRRLAPLILGQPTTLINNLLGGHVFRTGHLAQRLLAANLPDREDLVQQKLGAAVAQRATNGTFLVRYEGVEPCAESPSLEVWPLAYRRGIVHGLFFDEAGKVRISDWALPLIPEILRPAQDQRAELEQLQTLLGTSPIRTWDWKIDHQRHQQARALEAKFDPQARPMWTAIAGLFEPEAPF